NYATYVRLEQKNEATQTKANRKQQEEITRIKKLVAYAGAYANLSRDTSTAAHPLRGYLQTPSSPSLNSTESSSIVWGVDSRVGVLGANGAGKSTPLNLITGVLQPSQGAVSNHAALTLAQSSQRRADQVPYDKSPIDNEAMAWRQPLGRFGLSAPNERHLEKLEWYSGSSRWNVLLFFLCTHVDQRPTFVHQIFSLIRLPASPSQRQFSRHVSLLLFNLISSALFGTHDRICSHEICPVGWSIERCGRSYCPVHVRGALVQRHTFSVIRSPRHAPQFDVVEFVGLCAVRRRVGGRGDLFLLSCLRALCIAFAGSPARLIGVVEAASVTFLIINAFQLQYATLNGRTFNRIYA
ncbi:hypothetical protein CY34DRAFT_761802, partial [Suillus luteus UH-Slu-Lm8-n1]